MAPRLPDGNSFHKFSLVPTQRKEKWKLYRNIGGKIKVLAWIVCAIGIIASLLTAVGLWINNSSFRPTMAAGFTILLAGSVATYVTSLFIYGFGELIESTGKIRSMMEQERAQGEKDQDL